MWKRLAIARNGESYPLVKSSPNEFEYTEMMAVAGALGKWGDSL
ncbi:hypothetical protein [Trichothermofontia sp.]